jgi:hypothetical protein
MSAYPPPKENLPIFNPIDFVVVNLPLTIEDAKDFFLEYPSAQGLENLQTIIVNGASTFNDQSLINDQLTISQPTPSLNALNIENDNTSGYAIRATSKNSQGTAGVLTQISSAGANSVLNPIVQITDSVICASIYDTDDTGALDLTTQSTTANGIRITNGNVDIYGELEMKTNTAIKFYDGTEQTTAYTGSGSETLSAVLALGNNAGATDIDMNQQSITEIFNLSVGTGVAPYTNNTLITQNGNDIGFVVANQALGGTIDFRTNDLLGAGMVNLQLSKETGNEMAGTILFYNDATFSTIPVSTAVQPASSDSSTKIPTTAWVQSAISAGGGGSVITLSAVASSLSYDAGTNTTSWNFTTYPNWSAYSWVMTTPTASRTNVILNNLGSSPPLNVGGISGNNSFVLMSGTGINQPYTATSSNMITFCNGYQENYTISTTASSAQLSVINSIGATGSIGGFISNQLTENNGTCPPTANALSGYVILQALTDLTGLGSPTIVFTQLLA